MNKDQKQLQSLYESVSDSVRISSKKLTVLPEDWSQVDIKGDFWCYNNELTSLKGSPRSVGGEFSCSSNYLNSLVGAPKTVGGHFFCGNNPDLVSLEGAPRSVKGDFDCFGNPRLASLKGAPDYVGGEFRSDKFPDEEYREYIKDLHKYDKLKAKHKELEGIF